MGWRRPPWPTWPAARLLTPSWRVSTCSMPVTLLLSRFSERKKVLVMGGGLRVEGRHTFGGVAGLVILCEPAKVDVLHPWDPFLVLLVVSLLGPLHGCWCKLVC